MKVKDTEIAVVLRSGESLCFPWGGKGVQYVYFLDKSGEELYYWDCAEWQEDPEGVMGAIMGKIYQAMVVDRV